MLRSVRALAYLCTLATDLAPDYAIDRVERTSVAITIGDRLRPADGSVLLRRLYETIHDWPWWPGNRVLGQRLLAIAPRLAGVAGELRAASATASWWQPLDRAHQVWTSATAAAPADGVITIERRLHPWASKPWSAFWTSTALADGASWLLNPEASTLRSTDSSWQLQVAGDARVWELRGRSHWLELCRRYPQDSTDTYLAQWREWGIEAERIVTPDWHAVAADWDGVHLNVEGLLTTEGVPLKTAGGGTLLEGWGVESTLWFRWVFGPPQP